ncbi:hypothetical protein [Gemmatimonas sp.]|uniref:hypothetical protein n=1 Tax=Gemmatimonas sp. TaxID=1962908 RepID=UPI003DA69523
MKAISIATFINAIEGLPADPPEKSNVWYLTQKEHWLGWLGEYDGPGGYSRTSTRKRDAKYAYNPCCELADARVADKPQWTPQIRPLIDTAKPATTPVS